MADALIFDDDDRISSLMQDILEGLGLRVQRFADGNEAVEKIRSERPRLVLVDVMMPGLDGISICRMVKSDPALSRTKVAVVTGKGYKEDRELALKEAGADAFIEKPFLFGDFAKTVNSLLSAAAVVPLSAAPTSWSLKIWGQSEGGCVSLRLGDDLFVLDAGKAIERLVADRPRWGSAKRVWILLTHYHADHVSGLPHAGAWIRAGLTVGVFGPRDSVLPLSDRVAQELSAVPAEDLRRRSRSAELSEGGSVPDCPIKADVMATMHPGSTLAYRLEAGGRRIVFCPDNELKRGWEEARLGTFEKLATFSQGADLLIHDSRYTDGDYPTFALQGHSSPLAGLRLALRAGARRLLLYHTDTRYDEKARKAIEAGVRAAAAKEKDPPECLLASDGLEITI